MSAESIKVCVRFRSDNYPPESYDDWEFEKDEGKIKIKDKSWTYDYVLDHLTNQEEMYEKVAHQTITDFALGFNGTIFAYGQSGSGKTFSMLGPDDVTDALKKDFRNIPESVQQLYGITPRAVIQIFEAINNYVSQGNSVSLSCSYIEIYNEQINCILSKRENLKIREMPGMGMNVADKESIICKTPEEIFQTISIGSKNRAVCSTDMNSRSSRSHTILMIDFEYNGIDGVKRYSRLNLVDLAGSERLSKTGAEGKSLKEAQKINQSLTTLGMCIMALTTAGSKHIPFRNSKLTLILKESLGGNSKTTLLCTASRQKRHNEESVQTLYFASRAKAIKNNCKSNVQLGVKELQYLVDHMRKEILTLRGQLKKGGLTFNPILDSKLLAIIRNNEWEMDGEEISSGETSHHEDPRAKRASLIHLNEQEIILKYCELRAKFDNLLEAAGNKIYQLNNQSKTEIDHSLITDIKTETDEKLQEIIEEKTREMNLAHDQIEKYKKLLETKEDEYNLKIQNLSKEKFVRDEEYETLRKELEALREAYNLAQLEIQQLKEKIEKKKKKSSVIKEENRNLKNEVANNNSLIDELKKKISESESRSLEHKQKFDEINNKYELIQIEIENLNNLLKQKGENEEFQKNKIKELKDEINSNLDSISTTEKKFSDLNNKFSELELRFKSETEALNSKDLFNQSLIDQLKQENSNLNNAIQDKVSGQEICAEREKILSAAKANLEKRIEELLSENEKIKNEFSDSFSKFNTEKSELILQVDNLNRELKTKSSELENLLFELENVKKLFEEKLKSESQKVEQLNSRIEVTEKKRNELESTNLILAESEKKISEEKIQLEKDLKDKSAAYEEQKELAGKYLNQNEKLEREIKELREALAESQNRNKDDSDNEKKLLAEIALLKKDLEFQSKKVSDSEKKIEEIKNEKKVLQEFNQKLGNKVSQLEIENTRTRRVSRIYEKEINIIKDKAPISKNIFGVSLKKVETNNNSSKTDYIKQAIQETKEIKKKAENVYRDKLDELKGLRENIVCLSPKTISSRSSLCDIPEIDFRDEDFFKKNEHILLEKERIYQEEKEKKREKEEKDEKGMIV